MLPFPSIVITTMQQSSQRSDENPGMSEDQKDSK